MNNYDAEACMKAFTSLCAEVETNPLASTEDCQYWVFERGYKAAMEEILKVISVDQADKAQVETASTAKKVQITPSQRHELH
jgi:hypothetical protein